MEAVFTFAQTLSVTRATDQSALPGVVRRQRFGPAGVTQEAEPGHSITLRVVTVPPVENSPTTRRSAIVWAPVKDVVAPDVEQLTGRWASRQYPRSPGRL